MDTEQKMASLELALRAAAAAGDVIMSHFRRCDVDYKSDGSEVTIADREAERVIRGMIESAYPAHGILGEEYGESTKRDGRPLWIIDPIDGTTSFTWGIQAFGTLIGLLIDGEPIIGVIHMPALGETVYAAVGSGCWFRASPGEAPQRVHVTPCDELGDALVSASGMHATDLAGKTPAPRYRLSEVNSRAKKLRFCGDCLQHALVCRGRIHAAIDTVMQPWDIAALVPCIEEAGGVATSMDGRRDNVVFSGSLLSSCGTALHRALVNALKPAG